jgi:hypothetical protein
MFCDRCGASLQGTPNFCPICGRPFAAAPLMPVQNRTAGHVRLLGILWLALSAFRLLPGLFLLSFVSHSFRWWGSGIPFFVPGLIRMVGFALIAGGVIGIVAGWGLLDRQPWARMLALILGCFNLVDMPFGTALGVYTLWVLLPAQSEQEYRQISRVA